MIPHPNGRKTDITYKKTGILGRRQYPVPKMPVFGAFCEIPYRHVSSVFSRKSKEKGGFFFGFPLALSIGVG